MARTRYYKYVFSDNSIHFLTPEEADDFVAKNSGLNMVYDGYEMYISATPRVKDGFKPGWQPGLGMEVSSYSDYKKICKQRGYEIMGNDKFAHKKKEQRSKIVNDNVLRELVQRGAQISGREAEALKNGIRIHNE